MDRIETDRSTTSLKVAAEFYRSREARERTGVPQETPIPKEINDWTEVEHRKSGRKDPARDAGNLHPDGKASKKKSKKKKGKGKSRRRRKSQSQAGGRADETTSSNQKCTGRAPGAP